MAIDLTVNRTPVRLNADSKRVIARSFIPAGEGRVNAILNRVLSLKKKDAAVVLDRVLSRYSSRHKDISNVFERHYGTVSGQLNGRTPGSHERRWLIGAYFTSEYSLESVALFNPSMVPHPDQNGVAAGQVRFLMSLRACGEGHISSIEFRSGTIGPDQDISIDAIPPHAAPGHPVDEHVHDKVRFFLKLNEMGAYRPLADRVLAELPDDFTIDELETALGAALKKCRDLDGFHQMAEAMLWLAHSSYHIEFPEDSDLSERVIFPVTENESRGIEDARFVRFVGPEGHLGYYATCTAYNGVRSLPQLIETTDFLYFRISPLNGRCAANKGMALFPRKIADRYVMVSRIDGENLWVLRSDDIHFWNEAQKIQSPTHTWEFVQIGNCGSPIETEDGWLLLTHGVGPMREYWIGALLLDLEDPSKVIGHMKDPILVPTEEERDGYVPNVVYSCGAMVHEDTLFIPYGICDTATGIATVSLSELLSQLKSN